MNDYPDLYKLGYISNTMTMLRSQQGLPSQALANTCINTSPYAFDLYRDINESPEPIQFNSLCSYPSYSKICSSDCIGKCCDSCKSLLYYQPVVQVNTNSPSWCGRK